jgi:hypothetical protein
MLISASAFFGKRGRESRDSEKTENAARATHAATNVEVEVEVEEEVVVEVMEEVVVVEEMVEEVVAWKEEEEMEVSLCLTDARNKFRLQKESRNSVQKL